MCETKKRALALGYFDGLHIAHMKVLGAALEQKKNGLHPAVLLFDRHPAEVLFGAEVPRLLTDPDRNALLDAMGLERICLSFAELRDLTPEQFVKDLLVEKLNCGFVSCGYNYTFGKGGGGTVDTLRMLCDALGAGISVSAQVSANGTPVSSSGIRRAVESGDIETARKMLGRPLTFIAPVFSGDQRGRRLDAPTVNQWLPAGFVTPRLGVYATVSEVDGTRYPSVTDIGSRPTFGGVSLRSETHIMDFSGSLYGKEVRLYLLSFLRDEQKFSSFDALKTQIASDIALAKEKVVQSGFLSEKTNAMF